MHIYIQSHGLALAEALHAHAERRLRFNLAYASERTRRAATINLAEISAD